MVAKQKNKINNPKITSVFTDYGLLNWHLLGSDKIDYYSVPILKIKEQMIQSGINENNIYITGIPILNEFNPSLYKTEDTLKYKLKHNLPLFLFVAGGGLGYDNAFPYFKELLKNKSEFSVIFIAGKNQIMRKKADKLLKQSNKAGMVLGYTNDIAELINAADLVIGKLGGLITTEYIEMNTPICAIEPIPGQELKNIEFLLSNNFGIYSKTIEEFNDDIIKILKF